MNADFLQETYWGITVAVYLRLILIIAAALLLKRYLSIIFTRFFYTFFRKYSSGYFGQHFRSLLLRPVQGLIVTILFFIAYLQVSASLAQVIIWRSMKWQAGMKKVITDKVFTLSDILNHIFFFLIIYYAILLISRVLDFLFLIWIRKAGAETDKTRQQTLPLLRDVLKAVLWCFGGLTVLGAVFHVNIPTLVAGLGVGGIAIAFAAKESLENLLASFMVMIDKPFSIGDWVKIDDVEGIIERVGIRSSRIRTFDRSVIILPNRKLIDSNLENFSERGTRRIMFTIRALYGLPVETLERITEEIREMIQSVRGTDEAALTFVDSFGDVSINIQVIYYMKTTPDVDFIQVKEKVNLGIYEIMNRLGGGLAYATHLTLNTHSPDRTFPEEE